MAASFSADLVAFSRHHQSETGVASHPFVPKTFAMASQVNEFGLVALCLRPDPGIAVALKTPAELAAMIAANEFVQQLHIGALMLAELRGFMILPR
jgi:hypothetical protein